ncbi:MAG: homoserine dehydrogenase [Acutalibacteraceae bacterium]|nr:homoserine dehydrogenase [Acutalibacteraceae bacterium]
MMNIAILGFGTVGVGVYDIIAERDDICVKYVLDIKEHTGLTAISTTDINDILNDKTVDTVVEVIGGLHPSYEFVSSALKAGKNVITANKMLVSSYYKELTTLAFENSVALRYTAAVGGGIPWLVNLERVARVSKVCEVSGIMNGTSNYILDAMHTEKANFDECLKIAQNLGYAERDPSADIDGIDTLCKVVLSANIAFSCVLDKEKIDVAGIRYIKDCDIAVCEEMGRVTKLMGFAYKKDDCVSIFVEPTFISDKSLEASVHTNLNLISFEAEHVGRESFYGFGAGRYPTAYTVVEDCVDVANGVKKAYNEVMNTPVINNTEYSHKYYVRTDYSNEWFASLKTEKCGMGVITEEVSVALMHKFCKAALNSGNDCFIAGIND